MFSHLRKGIFNHLSKSCQGKQLWKLKAQILIKQWSDMSSSLFGSSDWKNRTQLLPIRQKWKILFLYRHGEHCQDRSYCVSALWQSQQPITFHFCHSVTVRQVRRDIEMLPITEASKGSVKRLGIILLLSPREKIPHADRCHSRTTSCQNGQQKD